MARFSFRMQPLLNVKLQMEDVLKNELGKAVQRLEHEKAVLKEIEDQREGWILRINQESSHGITVDKLREYSSYIAVLKDKMELQKENIKYAQENVDKYREELIKVVQERKMLEKLREKKLQEYTEEQNRVEQKLNDDLISFKYNDRLAGEENG